MMIFIFFIYLSAFINEIFNKIYEKYKKIKYEKDSTSYKIKIQQEHEGLIKRKQEFDEGKYND